MDPKKYHEPVLLREALEYLDAVPGKRIWDATVGTGGHSAAILKKIGPTGYLYCSDWDAETLLIASERLQKIGGNIEFHHLDFKEIGMGKISFMEIGIDGILVDLGISSYQLESKDRGFSFMVDGLLDMRMDRSKKITAEKIVNEYDYEEIKRILKGYGEEQRAAVIARRIVESRKTDSIRTTGDLRIIIESTVSHAGYRGRIHPATLTFQALRIAVNGELDNLYEGLEGLLRRLRIGGRMVVISFHSLEDRIVKTLFRRLAMDCQCPSWFPVCKCGHSAQVRNLTPKVIRPGPDEIAKNESSRSARLRAIEKIK